MGKEGNRLLERATGEITDPDDYRTTYTYGREHWRQLVLPVLRDIREKQFLRDDGDFEACSTVAIIDHLREHQAAGHTFHILTDAFDDLQADAAGNDAWIKTAGKDCRSRLQEPTPTDVLAEVRVPQVCKIDYSAVEVTRRNSH